MSHFASNPMSRSLIACVISTAMLIGAESNNVPNFAPDSITGWVAGVPDGVSPVGQDFLQPASGPGPVTFDKAHPYLDTVAARRAGAQPTLRVADLSNPILQSWVSEELRKVNERALTAIVMFTPKERCWPIGVPGFLLYPVFPIYFLQTPKEVVVERFRIIEDGKALEVNVHVEDPGAFTMPWKAVQRYRRVERGPMGEAVCAENNAKFFDYDVDPIPQTDEPDF